ncbi:hypothetical protein HDV05_001647 [Chytridiales sp. JEL 0842]|nr:hypothetical protein HDV05_001647 [Chytridiales sp. JEL 0842]
MGNKDAKDTGKKPKKEKAGPPPMPPEQVESLMTFLSVEARKQSVVFYRNWKDILRKQRARLHHLEQMEFDTISDIQTSETTLEKKIASLALETQLPEIKDEETLDDNLIATQRLHIAELQRIIDEVEDKIENVSLQIQDLTEFELNGGLQAQESRLEELQTLLQQRAHQHQIHLATLQRRHEIFVETGKKKTQQILDDLSAKANERGIREMSLERMGVVVKNRKLKSQLEVLGKERNRLRKLVESMEGDRMQLACHSTYSVDWNLNYDDDAPVQERLLPAMEDLPELPLQKYADGENRLNAIKDVDGIVNKMLNVETNIREKHVLEFGIIGKKKTFK